MQESNPKKCEYIHLTCNYYAYCAILLAGKLYFRWLLYCMSPLHWGICMYNLLLKGLGICIYIICRLSYVNTTGIYNATLA